MKLNTFHTYSKYRSSQAEVTKGHDVFSLHEYDVTHVFVVISGVGANVTLVLRFDRNYSRRGSRGWALGRAPTPGPGAEFYH